MEQKKIYVVHGSDTAVAPKAVFDSKEKAMSFANRFKKNKRYVVFEHDLNPSFIADNERTPYEVSFDIRGELDIGAFGLDDHEVTLATKSGHKVDGDKLSCYVIAKNEIDALSQAITIKNRLIAKGEWHEADLSNRSCEFESVSFDGDE